MMMRTVLVTEPLARKTRLKFEWVKISVSADFKFYELISFFAFSEICFSKIY